MNKSINILEFHKNQMDVIMDSCRDMVANPICKMCRGTGVIYVANGQDDCDPELCECCFEKTNL